jgi:hypothetical protein
LSAQPRDLGEEVFGRVIELKLGPPLVGCPDTAVGPELLDGGDIGRVERPAVELSRSAEDGLSKRLT